MGRSGGKGNASAVDIVGSTALPPRRAASSRSWRIIIFFEVFDLNTISCRPSVTSSRASLCSLVAVVSHHILACVCKVLALNVKLAAIVPLLVQNNICNNTSFFSETEYRDVCILCYFILLLLISL